MIIDYEDGDVRVGHLVVGRIDNNVYFVTDKSQDVPTSMMVDAASDGSLLVETCTALNVILVAETHNHWDHIGAIPEVRNAGLPVLIGEADAIGVGAYDGVLSDGQTLEVGNLKVDVLSTPGHTPGSMCFAVRDKPVLLTGDTLFPGGPGATHFPGGSFDDIVRSLDRLFVYADDTIVLPGHGDSTTIGIERPHVPEWTARRY